MLIIGPICQDYFITPIQHGWGNISLTEIKIKLQLFLIISVVIFKVNSTFTTIAGLMFNYEEFFTIELMANFFA